MKRENQLLENKKMREEVVGRIEVLEQVGELLLLPNTEFATTEMVAKYYAEDIETIVVPTEQSTVGEIFRSVPWNGGIRRQEMVAGLLTDCSPFLHLGPEVEIPQIADVQAADFLHFGQFHNLFKCSAVLPLQADGQFSGGRIGQGERDCFGCLSLDGQSLFVHILRKDRQITLPVAETAVEKLQFQRVAVAEIPPHRQR